MDRSILFLDIFVKGVKLPKEQKEEDRSQFEWTVSLTIHPSIF